MSNFHTNILSITYKGRSYTLRYWADGNGRHVDNYATSLMQLRSVLRRNVTRSPLDLYFVSSDRKMRLVTTDRHLKQALKHVPNRGTLHIYAYEHRETSFDLSAFV